MSIEISGQMVPQHEFQEARNRILGLKPKRSISSENPAKADPRKIPSPEFKRKSFSRSPPPLSNRVMPVIYKDRPLPKPPITRERPLPKPPIIEERPLPPIPVEVEEKKISRITQIHTCLKKKFARIVAFAKKIFSIISETLYGTCSKFKNITLICIGPFRFTRKKRSEIAGDCKIFIAPAFKAGVIPPPPPLPTKGSIPKQKLSEETSFPEPVNVIKSPRKELSEDRLEFNEKILKRRKAFEDDDEDKVWDVEWDPDNEGIIMMQAEDESDKAEVRHNLRTKETEVRVNNVRSASSEAALAGMLKILSMQTQFFGA